MPAHLRARGVELDERYPAGLLWGRAAAGSARMIPPPLGSFDAAVEAAGAPRGLRGSERGRTGRLDGSDRP